MVRLSHVLALAGTLASVLADSGARLSRPRAAHGHNLPDFKTLRRRQDMGDDGRLHRSEDTKDEAGVVQGAFMVELQDGVSVADLASELSTLDITFKTRQTMDYKLFKGLSFDVVGDSVIESLEVTEGAIASADGVKNVWPIHKVSVPADEVVQQHFATRGTPHSRERRDLERPYNPHVMTQIDRLHEAGFTGKGIRIGVIDTGIDYNNAILGGCFGPGCLVTHGWDSVGVTFIEDEYNFTPQPDDDPMDCNGHGTHVAGIVAARPNDFGFLGAAPDATLGAYRVLDCYGRGSEETMVMGMLRAFDDGSDILTMSVGWVGEWPDSLLSVTATRIVEAGVPVFVAVSNEGYRGGMFDIAAPANGHLVAGVASYDPEENPVVFVGAEYAVEDPDEKTPFDWVPSFWAAHDNDKVLPLIDLNSFVSSNGSGNGSIVTGCSRLPPNVPDLSGHLVLVKLSDNWRCDGWHQMQNIFARGGRHIFFWVPGEGIADLQLWWWGDLSTQVRLGVVTESTVKQWREVQAAGFNITATITSPEKAEPTVVWSSNNSTGGHVSEFSSWGPNLDMRVAPSFGGPGDSILSTHIASDLTPLSVVVMGGTSMSTPLVAGAAALLSQARGTLDPETLHSLLGSTSRQVAWNYWGELREGLTPVPHTGGGLVQLWDAAQAKGLLSTSSISFNDSDNHVSELTFTLLNTGDEEATYKLGHSAAFTTYALDNHGWPEQFYPFTTAAADITFDAEAVTVAAGAEVDITVRCTPPEADKARWPIYSGYLTLNGTNGDNLAVAYVGNGGSMRDAWLMPAQNGVVLSRGGWDLGMDVKPDAVFTVPEPIGDRPAEFDKWEDEVPVVMVYFARPSRILRFDLVATHSNRTTKCELPREDWLGYESYGEIWGGRDANTRVRDNYDRIFVGYLADGTPVPPGRYSILVSALRTFAEPTNDIENWQAIETVPFILQYGS